MQNIGGVEDAWSSLEDALRFAVSRIVEDPDPRNEREEADGHQYVVRMLAAVGESALLTFDPERPAFLPMLESVRYLGASGPDIDYDVAMVLPGRRHRVHGHRGDASFVGIAVYSFAGEKGASGIVASIDVDDLVDADGRFSYEFAHPEASRVIVRQYFHDRATQRRGSWAIDIVDGPDLGDAAEAPRRLPTSGAIAARVENAARSLRWNAQLNQLWSPERRAAPNVFVRQTPQEIVAAVTNPDVMYAFTWWRVGEGEVLVIDLVPPRTRYWSLQLCDRWFQCFPDRRSNLNDRQVVAEADGSVRIVLSDGDVGAKNWLDTSGHRVGTMFFRWLHADPDVLPTCRAMPVAELAR